MKKPTSHEKNQPQEPATRQAVGGLEAVPARINQGSKLNSLSWAKTFLCLLMAWSGLFSQQLLAQAAQAPIIFRVSDAVKPGELVTVYGENITSSGIQIAVDATTVGQPTGSSAMLTIVRTDPEGHFAIAQLPASLQAGGYNLWVRNASGWSPAIKLNAARPQWLSIDQVAEGLKVKVVGKNLDGLDFGASRNTRVKLVNGANEYNAQVLNVNPYAVEFTVAAAVPHATYQVQVSNDGGAVWRGLESDQTLRVVQKGDDPLGLGVFWAKDFNWSRQFNVRNYGAQGNGIANDTPAIQSAIDQLKSAGGGIVYFPNGTYKATSIRLPAGVVLRGENRENTVLGFAGTTNINFIDTKNDGTTNGRIGIANLKIGIDMNNSSQIYPDHFIWLGGATAEKIFIKDVTVDIPNVNRGGGRARSFTTDANQYVKVVGVVARGWRAYTASSVKKYSELSDCDFTAADQGVIANTKNMYTLMERNRIVFTASLTDQVVKRGFELTSHSYVAENHVEGCSGAENWNEQIMFEPRDGYTKMYGTVTGATSGTVTVNPRKQGDVLYGASLNNNWSLASSYPQGWYVIITDGRGLGQYRKVVSLNSTTSVVGVDKPWDVIPDNTSKFVILVPGLNNIAYKNTMITGSKPLLFYQNAFDSVFADNYSENTQGYNITHFYVLPSDVSNTRFNLAYFNRMVNNTAIGVATVRRTSGIGHHFDLQLTGAASENAYAYTCYGMDIKNNYVRSVLPAAAFPNTRETPPINGIYLGSHTRAGKGTKNTIKGATIENNIIRDSHRGISIGGTLFPTWNNETRANTAPSSYGIVVKDNKFMNVQQHIVDNQSQATFFTNNVAINDQTPPVTTAQVSGLQQGGSYSGSATVVFTASDNVAGVQSTEYSLDAGVTWKRYEVPVVFVKEGSYAIRYRSIDRVENVEQIKSLNFTVGPGEGGVTCIVPFDAQGGTTPDPASKTVTVGSPYGTLATTTRTGHTFAGWWTGAGSEITAATQVSNASNHTIFAKWTANTYTVTYNANGATSGTVPASQAKTHDVALTLAANSGNLARTGFTFAGWNTAADGTGTDYAGGGIYTGNDEFALFAEWTAAVVGPLATGGDLTEDITVDGINYRVHHFTSTTSHTFQVLADSLEVEYLIVGGGGGGGGLSSSNAAGAGGAGGYLTNVGGSLLSLSAGSQEIIVGAGGAGGTTSGTRGTQGASSSAFGLTAIGGGGGGGNAGGQQTGGTGGSGGGHGANHASAAAAGTAGQGNAGGTGFGGGGGAGAPGQASGTGDGLQNSITGTAVWVAGGGAGAFKSGVTPLGGGGSADTSNSGDQATDGQPNTGGGGGALWRNGAKAGRSGGSGIVIVRYVVHSGGGTPFEQWAGAPDMEFVGDASGDGISNGMAFLLGASSPEDDAHQLLPAPARTAEGLALSFQMRDAASRGTASLSIEHSSDLVNWPTIPIPDSSNTSPEGVVFQITRSGLHQVTVTIPSSHASGGKLYARLKASDR